jgi:NTE family protein
MTSSTVQARKLANLAHALGNLSALSKAIRLALSGSGFKFPAHVGALMAVRDAGFKPIQYAGTSGGSIIAMLAACGMDLDDMHTLTMTTDWSDMLTFSPWSLIANKGYCSGDTLLNWMIDKSDGKTFAELDTDLVIMASDITNAAPFEFSRRTTPNVKVALAARASASIPVAYAPVEYNGYLLEDGGVENNIPADKLILDSVPRLGIQLVSKSAPLTPGGHSFLSTLPRLVNMLLDANENTHVDLEEQEGTHFAFVETGFANGLDRNMSASVMMQLRNNGYASAQRALASLATA